MKMKKSTVKILFFGLLLLFSCTKKGCADVNAVNYNDRVKGKNSCDCIYSYDLVFWSDKQFSDSCLSNQYEKLNLYCDGSYVGEIKCDEYFNSIPECSNIYSLKHHFGSSEKQKNVIVKIFDQDNNLFDQFTLNLTPNCNFHKLIY